MKKIVRAMPGKPLGNPKIKFENTFSAETVVLERFFAKGGYNESKTDNTSIPDTG